MLFRTASLALLGLAALVVASPSSALSATKMNVVLLGDSYSAGNGASHDYYGPAGCYRSKDNWAEKYRAWLGESTAAPLVNRACSGGVVANIFGARSHGDDAQLEAVTVPGTVGKDDLGARNELRRQRKCETRYPGDEAYRVEAASAFSLAGSTTVTYRCWRYMEPQAEAVSKDTDLVLLTMGGNDLQFSEIVKQCYVAGIRDPGECRKMVEGLDPTDPSGIKHIPAVEADLRTMLIELRRKMRPDARIVLLGYPYLERDEDVEIKLRFRDSYNLGERIRYFQRLGDEAQERAVAAANASDDPGAGVVFIGRSPASGPTARTIKERFKGHEPTGVGKNDDRWIVEPTDTVLKETWYHPNPRGQEEYAWALKEFGDFGTAVPAIKGAGSVDLVFVIDTTGSMGDAIGSVKEGAQRLVASVRASSKSARFALVDYRDFAERIGD
ncbi:MAG: hypothetical protein J7513_04655, partial [Solirubrobacteraceae bacterium]|nr:hypothetical protein [Solirubrobacteraceae bacterium]